jgi:pyruvate/2-oxoglutarate dehydrogenase complex dihydrolipoamide dehydrogenase (E3) component
MQVADRIYAVGDVTGRGPFTHVAVWQARVLIAHLLGRPEPYGGYAGLAWVTFTDPEVGRVGQTEQQARQAGLDVAVGISQIASNARGWIHGPGNDGFVKLVADRSAGVLVGGTVVAPAGGEILGLLTLAVHARVPLATLRTMHYAYPTLHRAVSEALQAMD